jgi:hypothetical protein
VAPPGHRLAGSCGLTSRSDHCDVRNFPRQPESRYHQTGISVNDEFTAGCRQGVTRSIGRSASRADAIESGRALRWVTCDSTRARHRANGRDRVRARFRAPETARMRVGPRRRGMVWSFCLVGTRAGLPCGCSLFLGSPTYNCTLVYFRTNTFIDRRDRRVLPGWLCSNHAHRHQ